MASARPRTHARVHFLDRCSSAVGVGLSQCIKYPNVVDYQHAISQLDEKELANLRLCAADLRNNVAILYDVIVKNLDRIKKPRSSNATSMY